MSALYLVPIQAWFYLGLSHLSFWPRLHPILPAQVSKLHRCCTCTKQGSQAKKSILSLVESKVHQSSERHRGFNLAFTLKNAANLFESQESPSLASSLRSTLVLMSSEPVCPLLQWMQTLRDIMVSIYKNLDFAVLVVRLVGDWIVT